MRDGRDREEDLKWSMGECCKVARSDVPGCSFVAAIYALVLDLDHVEVVRIPES